MGVRGPHYPSAHVRAVGPSEASFEESAGGACPVLLWGPASPDDSSASRRHERQKNRTRDGNGGSHQGYPLLHSALDQQMLGASFRIGKTEFDSLCGNLTNRFFGPVEFEAIIEKRVANAGISLLKATIAFGRGCQLKSLLLLECLRSDQEEQAGGRHRMPAIRRYRPQALCSPSWTPLGTILLIQCAP
jgi:hypothetical protein